MISRSTFKGFEGDIDNSLHDNSLHDNRAASLTEQRNDNSSEDDDKLTEEELIKEYSLSANI